MEKPSPVLLRAAPLPARLALVGWAVGWAVVGLLAAPVRAQAPATSDAAPDAAPDALEEPAEAHGDVNRYLVEVEKPPQDVVAELMAAAQRGDLTGYQAHLSQRFRSGVALLQQDAVANDQAPNPWDWSIFLGATASSSLSAVEVKAFYERASVWATTTDGRTIKFTLVVEDGAWKVDLPPDLLWRVEAIEARLNPPAPAADEPDDGGEPAPPTSSLSPTGPVGQGSDLPLAASIDPGPVVAPPPEEPKRVEPGFFDAGSIGHYLWYTPDYLALAASASYFALGLHRILMPPWILIGPEYNMASPDTRGLLDRRLDPVIGQPMVAQKVPEWTIAAVAGVGFAGLASLDVARHLEFHHTHAFVLGAAESAMLALSATEVLKLGVGRLRPDFRERYVRAACGGYVEAPSSLDCDTLDPNDGFVVTQADVVEGMKSFPSGHSSVSFAMATYFALYVGGEYVWGDSATFWTAPLGAAAMGTFYTLALFVAASRVSDNRHHLEDVVVGAGLGSAAAAGTYFLHFDTRGRARWRSFRLSALSVEGEGGGLALSGTF